MERMTEYNGDDHVNTLPLMREYVRLVDRDLARLERDVTSLAHCTAVLTVLSLAAVAVAIFAMVGG